MSLNSWGYFNRFSLSWLKCSLNKDLYKMESEIVDVRKNVERKKSQDFKKKRKVGGDYFM